MSPKLPSALPYLILLSLLFFYLYSTSLPPHSTTATTTTRTTSCNLFKGNWVLDRTKSTKPLYDESCPFHRNAWNCLRNQRENMGLINSWRWVPKDCDLPKIDPERFLELMRNRNIGFVGDSLNENFLVSFLCSLRVADGSAKKWKRKGAWRGAYFPKFNVTVAYHRAVLLAKYDIHVCLLRAAKVTMGYSLSLKNWILWIFKVYLDHFVRIVQRECNLCWKPLVQPMWQPKQPTVNDGRKGLYRVDVDIPAEDWATITDYYDVLIFNTGHWWGYEKFPKETPLVFYRAGQPILPPLGLFDGLKVVLENMVSYIEREVSRKTLKFWRLQSPRHFYGGEWNQNGSCLLNEPLKEHELDLWFDPRNNGVNKEARKINHVIEETLQGTDIRLLDLTHLSEFRADAHPAIWLGKKDAVAIWGQDCMHWCLPGVPDTWVDIFSGLIHNSL